MSSATSTDAAKATSAAVPPPAPAADSAQPWHFFVVASLAAATLAVVVSARIEVRNDIALTLVVRCAQQSLDVDFGSKLRVSADILGRSGFSTRALRQRLPDIGL